MKRRKQFLIAFLLTALSFLCSGRAAGAAAMGTDAQLDDLVITLLMPSISEAAGSFYEPYLTIRPTVAPYYESKITEIRGGGSHYAVTVEVLPYVGPHISVGKDRITLDVRQYAVSVEHYEHLESHVLPQHLQSLLKKPLP
ncbi:MAG TPA: DUF3888 domain-containing protein [Pseudoflavonifractor sp.]|nr:DUF3888 domain-containing protein [Pseudoflavonifractor sp.]